MVSNLSSDGTRGSSKKESGASPTERTSGGVFKDRASAAESAPPREKDMITKLKKTIRGLTITKKLLKTQNT